MNKKKPYFSQFHQLNSRHLEPLQQSSSVMIKIGDHRPCRQTKAKEVLIRFDQERSMSQKCYDVGAIDGWNQTRKQSVKNLSGCRRQIRRHQKLKKRGNISYDPKYLEHDSTKATISYLKEMLNYLRGSNETNSKTDSLTSKSKRLLPSIQYNHLDAENDKTSTLQLKNERRGGGGRLKRKKEQQSKENIYKEEDIIDQLVNGLHRGNVLGPSNRVGLMGRRKGDRFTLDKLLF